jgi:5-(carboxyamino)imidazole ribonucleotide synthase
MEFENLPVQTISLLEEHVLVRPAGRVLHTTQNRLREKTFLQENGFPLPRFVHVSQPDQLLHALQRIGLPAVVKTVDWGYDGKGQTTISEFDQVDYLTRDGSATARIAEEFIDLECELSVVVARSASGNCQSFPPIRNRHRAHILDLSVSPAGLTEHVARDAINCAEAIAAKLDAVGVICVEFFLTRQGRLLVNEIAPRTHNSGHLTIEAHSTSQFEQHVRAVCGLPLGSVDQHLPAATANLLGSVWATNPPNWSAALRLPNTHLHLYGKSEPHPRRKMGHITALAATAAAASSLAIQARSALAPNAGCDPAQAAQ